MESRVIKVKVDLVKGDQMASGNNTFFCEVSVTGRLDAEPTRQAVGNCKGMTRT